MSLIKDAKEPGNKPVNLNGQWFGFYQYGPEYGPGVEGEKIIFSIIIEQSDNRSFVGKCVELEGIGSASEIARLQGYIDDTFISFVKQYTKASDIRADKPEESPVTRLMYSGTIDMDTETITGKWEVWKDDTEAASAGEPDISTGSWEISRDPARYGI